MPCGRTRGRSAAALRRCNVHRWLAMAAAAGDRRLDQGTVRTVGVKTMYVVQRMYMSMRESPRMHTRAGRPHLRLCNRGVKA